MFTDARDYQILFLTVFLGLGVSTKDWTLRPGLIGVAIAMCLVVQAVAALLKFHYPFKTPGPDTKATNLAEAHPPRLDLGWRSALITGLGLSLLLRTDHWTTMP